MDSVKGSRFLELLQQLRECHEQELSRSAAVWHESSDVAVTEVLVPMERPTVGQAAELAVPTAFMVQEVSASPRPSRNSSNPSASPRPSRNSSNPEGSSLDSTQNLELEAMSKETSCRDVPRFQIRELWRSEWSGTKGVVRMSRQTSPADMMETDDAPSREKAGVKNCSERFIAYPGSPARFCWDMIGGFVVIYDFVVIPLNFFDPPETAYTILMDWFTLVFWSLNVFATVTVGYVKDGTTIMDPAKIIANYLKTWFILDAITLVPDWVCTALAVGDGVESVRILRTFRMVRTVRLLRIAKLKRVLDALRDHLDSEYSSLVFRIIKLMTVLLLVAHVVACFWFGVARANENTDMHTWVKADGIYQWDWSEKYLISLHWALTQFTPSTMHVQPQNGQERLFNVCTVIFALVGFSYVLGSIASNLAKIHALTEKASKDFGLLRRFLKKNQVPGPLAARIQRFIEHAYNREKENMGIHQVEVLSLLSKQLMEELQCGINMPHLKVHPLFEFLSDHSSLTMNQVAKAAVARSDLARGDTLFLAQQLGAAMYFIVNGRIHYSRMVNGEEKSQEVGAGKDWLGEPVLWTESWHFVGHATAQSECELVIVESKAFEEILRCWKPIADVVGEYGRNFIAWLVQQEDLSDVTRGEHDGTLLCSFIPVRDKRKSVFPAPQYVDDA